MKQYYKLTDIVHSGRKGIRGQTVTEEKYNGLIGLKVGFDIEDIKRFESTRIYLINCHSYYRWWDTSAVIALSTNQTKDYVELETVNAIYKFEKWKDDDEKVGD